MSYSHHGVYDFTATFYTPSADAGLQRFMNGPTAKHPIIARAVCVQRRVRAHSA